MTDKMSDSEIQDWIKLDEGYRPHVYLDTKGIPTAGYGHAFLPNSPIPHDVANLLFEMDWGLAIKRYSLYAKRYELDLNPVRRGVIVNMMYQMGYLGVRRFARMTKCLQMEDYEGAADEMLDSQWARNHKARSGRLARWMRAGEINNKK